MYSTFFLHNPLFYALFSTFELEKKMELEYMYVLLSYSLLVGMYCIVPVEALDDLWSRRARHDIVFHLINKDIHNIHRYIHTHTYIHTYIHT